MDVTYKSAAVSPLPDSEQYPNGSFEVILSTPTEDRDGEEVKSAEWKMPLPEHITFDADHGMSVEKTVGSGKPFLDEQGRLIVRGSYASTPLAQEVRSLVGEGHIRTTSVAFMKTISTDRKSGAKTVTRELLNGAFVAIPANKEAVVVSSKSMDPELRRKSILGSVEALQDRVCDAVEDTYPGIFHVIRGVIPADDASGVVIYCEYDDSWKSETYQQAFTDDGAVITLAETRQSVDIFEVVMPNADEARDEAADEAAATSDDAEMQMVTAALSEEVAIQAQFIALMALAAE